jgi:hypothetical protein
LRVGQHPALVFNFDQTPSARSIIIGLIDQSRTWPRGHRLDDSSLRRRIAMQSTDEFVHSQNVAAFKWLLRVNHGSGTLVKHV